MAAQGQPGTTHRSGEVEGRPIHELGVDILKDGPRQLLKVRIISNIHKLSRPKETLKDSRHVRVDEGLGVRVRQKQDGIGDVLPDCWKGLELFPASWELPPSLVHLGSESAEGGNSATPEPQGFQVDLKIFFRSLCEGLPRAERLGKTGQNATHSLGRGSLKEDFCKDLHEEG